jgi:hypothetical protein
MQRGILGLIGCLLATMPAYCVASETEEPETQIKTAVRKALDLLRTKIKPSDVERTPGEPPILVIDKGDMAAVYAVKLCRTHESVGLLLPFLDVRFMVASKLGARPVDKIELFADDTLKEIGLPAVDEILKRASEGTLGKLQEKPAKRVCLEILGEEGLSSRARFLNLGKDVQVKKFLALKP